MASAPPGGEAVTFEVIHQTRSSHFDAATPTAVAVMDVAAWEQLWAAHRSTEIPRPALPVVDFSSHVVVAVFAGPGAGGLTITRIIRRGEELAVSAERADRRGCPGLSVVEHSAELVRVSIPVGRVTLDLRTVGKGCG